MLEELEIPYEIRKYQRQADKLAPRDLKDVHTLGKAPIITDGDVTLAESGAIVEYLITKYGKGRAQPPSSGWVDNLYCEPSSPMSFDEKSNQTNGILASYRYPLR